MKMIRKNHKVERRA